MKMPYYRVSAFTSEPFSGNPACVCLLESWPDDALLQAIAKENGVSETAFVVSDEALELRWFTPEREVPLCGHATLAAAHVLFGAVLTDAEELAFETRWKGRLTVRREAGGLAMSLPAHPPEPHPEPERVAEALGGTEPVECLASLYSMAVLEDEDALVALAPDLGAVAALEPSCLVVTAPGREADLVSRFFAPAEGIPEDPVTGSAHTMLGPYWAARLGRSTLSAAQLSERGGHLDLRLVDDRVVISGDAVVYQQGLLVVPTPADAMPEA